MAIEDKDVLNLAVYCALTDENLKKLSTETPSERLNRVKSELGVVPIAVLRTALSEYIASTTCESTLGQQVEKVLRWEAERVGL